MTPEPSSGPRRLALELLLASSIVLFQELTLIRWLSGLKALLLLALCAYLAAALSALREESAVAAAPPAGGSV